MSKYEVVMPFRDLYYEKVNTEEIGFSTHQRMYRYGFGAALYFLKSEGCPRGYTPAELAVWLEDMMYENK